MPKMMLFGWTNFLWKARRSSRVIDAIVEYSACEVYGELTPRASLLA